MQSGKGKRLRSGLVVFQFSCTLFLFITTITIYQQVNHMDNQDLGIQLDQKIMMYGPQMSTWDSTFIERIESFKTELKLNPHIKQVTSSQRMAGQILPRVFNVYSPRNESNKNVSLGRLNVDHEFFETYKLELVTGRVFRKEDHSQQWDEINTVVITESASDILGISEPEQALASKIRYFNKDWEIVGVVKDFHYRGLRHPIEPIVFQPAYSTYDFYTVSVQANEVQQSLKHIEKTFSSLFPGNVFEYFFMDERFAMQYKEDKRYYQMFAFFSILAILIASLGLLDYRLTMQLRKPKKSVLEKSWVRVQDKLLVYYSKIPLFCY